MAPRHVQSRDNNFETSQNLDRVLQAVFGKKHDSDLEFKKALTDGTLLCRLINKVVPNTIPFVNVGRNPITWLENVQFFLDGCRRVGLKEDMLFEPYDIKYFGNNEEELARRNRKIAVTLFWLSRIAPDHLIPLFATPDHLIPLFATFEDYQTVADYQTVVLDGEQEKEHCEGHNKEPDKGRKKSVVFEDDLCNLCKRSRARSDSSERVRQKSDISERVRQTSAEDGKFTLLVERSEKSNEFGVTIKETDTDYPVITAVQIDSYAHKSGLAIGDYVITINGINTGNMSLAEINDKIKSVFTEGHVYLGICRLPPNESLTQQHKDSPLFQQRIKSSTGNPGNKPVGDGSEVPLVRSKTISNVESAPLASGPDLSEWRAMLEKHKRETYRSELDHVTIRDLWNKYIKTSEIDEVLSEVNNFNIDKANKFRESVAQTDGNDSLDRNLTLVGHKLRRSADTYNNHLICGCCVKAIGTLASIHLDDTNFTYHQTCFSCKHCGVMLLEHAKLLYNVFVVDGLPYCDVCIKKMGMIRLGKIKKMPLKTSV